MTRFEKEKRILLNKERKETFFKAYYDIIVLFEEDKPDSKYLQDYQLLENAPKIRQLTKVIESHKNEKELINEFKRYLSEGETNIIHQVLIDDFLYSRSIVDNIDISIIYLNLLTSQEKEEEKLKTIVRQFGNLYVTIIRIPHVPRYPDSNFFTLLEELMTIKPTQAHILIISILTDCYIPYLTKTVDPLYYNTAEKLLNYFVTVKNKYPKFNYNLELIKKLNIFVRKAAETRKLKGLAKSLAIAEKVFA